MTTLQDPPLNTPISNEGTRRYKCPVHHGKRKNVAVWWDNGPRAWCHSHQCSQSDILAALGLTSTQPFTWTPPPPPRLRPTNGVKPLLPVTPAQALNYLSGIKTHQGAQIAYQRADGQSGKHWRNLDKRRNPGVTGDGCSSGGLTRLTRPAPWPFA